MNSTLLQRFDHPLFARHNLSVDILRLDLIDPHISGNKWFKLLPLLPELRPGRPLLSFGGAYSNHLHALARFGQRYSIPTIGVVRGDPVETPTLLDAQRWGMQLHFIDRQSYRALRDEAAPQGKALMADLAERFGEVELIPEGGATDAALRGCSTLWSLLPEGYRVDRLLVGVGTGTTLAGLALGAPEGVQLEGFAAINDYRYLERSIESVLALHNCSPSVRWRLLPGSELGFAKLNLELAALWSAAAARGVELDPVYTLRTLHAFIRRLLAGEYRAGERILLVHTGGLQGLRGQQARLSRLASAHCGPMAL